jgi:hypothetical protein
MAIGEDVWWLASAGQYQDRANQACFAPREITNFQQFGWDRTSERLILRKDWGSWAVCVDKHLSAPVAAVKELLLRCTDEKFRGKFLLDPYPSTEEVEVISRMSIEGPGLAVKCSATTYTVGSAVSPGLTLVSTDPSVENLFLFNELRQSLGRCSLRLSPATIHANLYTLVTTS